MIKRDIPIPQKNKDKKAELHFLVCNSAFSFEPTCTTIFYFLGTRTPSATNVSSILSESILSISARETPASSA